MNDRWISLINKEFETLRARRTVVTPVCFYRQTHQGAKTPTLVFVEQIYANSR